LENTPFILKVTEKFKLGKSISRKPWFFDVIGPGPTLEFWSLPPVGLATTYEWIYPAPHNKQSKAYVRVLASEQAGYQKEQYI
jgi:hypothetical protein